MAFPGTRVLASAVAVATVLASTTASAAEPAPEPAAAEAEPTLTPQESAALEKAKQLYLNGEAHYDTAHYQQAIDTWVEAYAMLPKSAVTIRAILIYNIATAQERAFEVDRDVEHLRQALILLRSWEAMVPEVLAEHDQDDELTKLHARMDALQARLDEAEAQARADEAAKRAAAAKANKTSEPADDTPPPVDPTARPMIIAGSALVGVGVAGLGLMVGGMVMGQQADQDVPEDFDERSEQFSRGETGNTLAIVGGAVGGVLIVSGAVVLGLGLKRKRNPRVSAMPVAGAGFAGVQLGGRF